MRARETMRWPALDGLRAIAVLFVMCFHFGAPFGTGGYLGVDVFFVISGCVVTLSLLRSWNRPHGVRAFFWRRAIRLFPNLLALVLAAIAWDAWREGALLTPHNQAVLEGLLQVYDFFLTPDIATPHLWSLSMEWQFYLALPIVLWALLRLGFSAGAMVALTYAAFSLGTKWLLPSLGAGLLHLYFWPFARFDEFVLGIAITMLLERGWRWRNRWLPTLLSMLVVTLMVTSPLWWAAARRSLFVIMPIAALSTFLIVWSIASDTPTPMRTVLEWRPLRYLGERSYSLYLWHYFVGVALIASARPTPAGWIGPPGEGWEGPLVFSVQMAATLVLGIMAYELIERPARSALARWRTRAQPAVV